MQITREFMENCDRYYFDNNLHGYAQVDTNQDASYFGVWANPATLTIVSYCEGDVTTCKCETSEEFVEYFTDMKKVDDGRYFIGIDPFFNQELHDRFVNIGMENFLH